MKYLAAVALLALATTSSQSAHAQAVSDAVTPQALFPGSTAQIERSHDPSSRAAPDESDDSSFPLPEYGAWIGKAKWLTLTASAGLGVLGFKIHADADEGFDALVRLCDTNPNTCRELAADSSFLDTRAEELFQEVSRKDEQARLALIGSQMFFAASVILFIVDFENRRGPQDVPYIPDEEKSPLALSLVPGEISIKYYFPQHR